jgi:hypothetical protein
MFACDSLAFSFMVFSLLFGSFLLCPLGLIVHFCVSLCFCHGNCTLPLFFAFLLALVSILLCCFGSVLLTATNRIELQNVTCFQDANLTF